MKICFFGVGGVGGYFATLITKKFHNQHEIYFVARGKHKEAIQSNGITLKKGASEEVITATPKRCTDNMEEIPVCDIIFLAVKAYDLRDAAIAIAKIANEQTVILPLLNGVDIYERIRSCLKWGIVLPSCVYIGTHVESPGVIYQKGGSCKIALGNDPEHKDFHPVILLSLLKDAEIDYSWEEKIAIPIWSKFLFIAAYGLITATYEKTLGEVLEDPALARLTKSIMYEIEGLAKGIGIVLDAEIVEASFLKAKGFPYETKTSLQRDIEQKGSVNEADLFGGTLLRYSNHLKMPTPTIRATYEKLLSKF
jgi:2-dehydropantoate 2-reductase